MRSMLTLDDIKKTLPEEVYRFFAERELQASIEAQTQLKEVSIKHETEFAQTTKRLTEKEKTLHPDIIVMDVNMPKLNGIEATRRIVEEWPEVQIIGLSVQEDEHVQKIMLEAGAVRFLTKNGVANELVDGIRHLVL